MKYFVILLVLIGSLGTIFSISDVFGLCYTSPDWPDEPCYGKRGEGPSLEQLRQDWSAYYDFKGSEWMESKKQEMVKAIQNGTLFEWIQLTQNNRTNANVHNYYFLFGKVPNEDGIFAEEYFAEEKLAIASDTITVGVDYTTPMIFLILGIAPATLMGIAIFWMKRK